MGSRRKVRFFHTFFCLTCLALAAFARAPSAKAGESDPAPVGVTTITEDRSVEEELVIRSGETLCIQPGVTLRFAPGVGVTAEGKVEAVGTKEKPIRFDARDPNAGWANVFLKGAGAARSRFAHCRFAGGRGRSYRFDRGLRLQGVAEPPAKGLGCGGAVFLYAVRSAVIEDCIFEGNRAGWSGGAVTCWAGSCPRIERNLFLKNEAGEDGGAVHCVLRSCPALLANAMVGNRAQYGGAIHCLHMSHPVIAWNDIRNNEGTKSAGGVSCYNECTPVLLENRITGNVSPGEGAMNAARNSFPTLVGNYIEGNRSGKERGELPSQVKNAAPGEKEAVLAKMKAMGTPSLPAGEPGEREKKEKKEGEGF